jgi:hypothetical protein
MPVKEIAIEKVVQDIILLGDFMRREHIECRMQMVVVLELAKETTATPIIRLRQVYIVRGLPVSTTGR